MCLKAILGFFPHDLQPYRLALTHKSLSYHEQKEAQLQSNSTQEELQKQSHLPSKNKKKKGEKASPTPPQSRINNERLEFLGDAVIGAVVADILYKHYRNKQEGFLTTLRSKLICRATLNQVAIDLGLDKLIHYYGEITTGHNSFMNGNAFEAFVGAIYLDRGYRYCYRFLEEKVFHQLIDIEQMEHQEQNFKSRVIEWCQKRQYKFDFTQEETRDSHKSNIPVFRSTVLIEGIPWGTGLGYSKKESDQEAARVVYTRLQHNPDIRQGIAKAAQSRKAAAQQLASPISPQSNSLVSTCTQSLPEEK